MLILSVLAVLSAHLIKAEPTTCDLDKLIPTCPNVKWLVQQLKDAGLPYTPPDIFQKSQKVTLITESTEKTTEDEENSSSSEPELLITVTLSNMSNESSSEFPEDEEGYMKVMESHKKFKNKTEEESTMETKEDTSSIPTIIMEYGTSEPTKLTKGTTIPEIIEELTSSTIKETPKDFETTPVDFIKMITSTGFPQTSTNFILEQIRALDELPSEKITTEHSTRLPKKFYPSIVPRVVQKVSKMAKTTEGSKLDHSYIPSLVLSSSKKKKNMDMMEPTILLTETQNERIEKIKEYTDLIKNFETEETEGTEEQIEISKTFEDTPLIEPIVTVMDPVKIMKKYEKFHSNSQIEPESYSEHRVVILTDRPKWDQDFPDTRKTYILSNILPIDEILPKRQKTPGSYIIKTAEKIHPDYFPDISPMDDFRKKSTKDRRKQRENDRIQSMLRPEDLTAKPSKIPQDKLADMTVGYDSIIIPNSKHNVDHKSSSPKKEKQSLGDILRNSQKLKPNELWDLISNKKNNCNKNYGLYIVPLDNDDSDSDEKGNDSPDSTNERSLSTTPGYDTKQKRVTKKGRGKGREGTSGARSFLSGVPSRVKFLSGMSKAGKRKARKSSLPARDDSRRISDNRVQKSNNSGGRLRVSRSKERDPENSTRSKSRFINNLIIPFPGEVPGYYQNDFYSSVTETNPWIKPTNDYYFDDSPLRSASSWGPLLVSAFDFKRLYPGKEELFGLRNLPENSDNYAKPWEDEERGEDGGVAARTTDLADGGGRKNLLDEDDFDSDEMENTRITRSIKVAKDPNCCKDKNGGKLVIGSKEFGKSKLHDHEGLDDISLENPLERCNHPSNDLRSGDDHDEDPKDQTRTEEKKDPIDKKENSKEKKENSKKKENPDEKEDPKEAVENKDPKEFVEIEYQKEVVEKPKEIVEKKDPKEVVEKKDPKEVVEKEDPKGVVEKKDPKEVEPKQDDKENRRLKRSVKMSKKVVEDDRPVLLGNKHGRILKRNAEKGGSLEKSDNGDEIPNWARMGHTEGTVRKPASRSQILIPDLNDNLIIRPSDQETFTWSPAQHILDLPETYKRQSPKVQNVDQQIQKPDPALHRSEGPVLNGVVLTKTKNKQGYYEYRRPPGTRLKRRLLDYHNPIYPKKKQFRESLLSKITKDNKKPKNNVRYSKTPTVKRKQPFRTSLSKITKDNKNPKNNDVKHMRATDDTKILHKSLSKLTKDNKKPKANVNYKAHEELLKRKRSLLEKITKDNKKQKNHRSNPGKYFKKSHRNKINTGDDVSEYPENYWDNNKKLSNNYNDKPEEYQDVSASYEDIKPSKYHKPGTYKQRKPDEPVYDYMYERAKHSAEKFLYDSEGSSLEKTGDTNGDDDKEYSAPDDTTGTGDAGDTGDAGGTGDAEGTGDTPGTGDEEDTGDTPGTGDEEDTGETGDKPGTGDVENTGNPDDPDSPKPDKPKYTSVLGNFLYTSGNSNDPDSPKPDKPKHTGVLGNFIYTSGKQNDPDSPKPDKPKHTGVLGNFIFNSKDPKDPDSPKPDKPNHASVPENTAYTPSTPDEIYNSPSYDTHINTHIEEPSYPDSTVNNDDPGTMSYGEIDKPKPKPTTSRPKVTTTTRPIPPPPIINDPPLMYNGKEIKPVLNEHGYVEFRIPEETHRIKKRDTPERVTKNEDTTGEDQDSKNIKKRDTNNGGVAVEGVLESTDDRGSDAHKIKKRDLDDVGETDGGKTIPDGIIQDGIHRGKSTLLKRKNAHGDDDGNGEGPGDADGLGSGTDGGTDGGADSDPGAGIGPVASSAPGAVVGDDGSGGNIEKKEGEGKGGGKGETYLDVLKDIKRLYRRIRRLMERQRKNPKRNKKIPEMFDVTYDLERALAGIKELEKAAPKLMKFKNPDNVLIGANSAMNELKSDNDDSNSDVPVDNAPSGLSSLVKKKDPKKNLWKTYTKKKLKQIIQILDGDDDGNGGGKRLPLWDKYNKKYVKKMIKKLKGNDDDDDQDVQKKQKKIKSSMFDWEKDVDRFYKNQKPRSRKTITYEIPEDDYDLTGDGYEIGDDGIDESDDNQPEYVIFPKKDITKKRSVVNRSRKPSLIKKSPNKPDYNLQKDDKLFLDWLLKLETQSNQPKQPRPNRYLSSKIHKKRVFPKASMDYDNDIPIWQRNIELQTPYWHQIKQKLKSQSLKPLEDRILTLLTNIKNDIGDKKWILLLKEHLAPIWDKFKTLIKYDQFRRNLPNEDYSEYSESFRPVIAKHPEIIYYDTSDEQTNTVTIENLAKNIHPPPPISINGQKLPWKKINGSYFILTSSPGILGKDLIIESQPGVANPPPNISVNGKSIIWKRIDGGYTAIDPENKNPDDKQNKANIKDSQVKVSRSLSNKSFLGQTSPRANQKPSGDNSVDQTQTRPNGNFLGQTSPRSRTNQKSSRYNQRLGGDDSKKPQNQKSYPTEISSRLKIDDISRLRPRRAYNLADPPIFPVIFDMSPLARTINKKTRRTPKPGRRTHQQFPQSSVASRINLDDSVPNFDQLSLKDHMRYLKHILGRIRRFDQEGTDIDHKLQAGDHPGKSTPLDVTFRSDKEGNKGDVSGGTGVYKLVGLKTNMTLNLNDTDDEGNVLQDDYDYDKGLGQGGATYDNTEFEEEAKELKMKSNLEISLNLKTNEVPPPQITVEGESVTWEKDTTGFKSTVVLKNINDISDVVIKANLDTPPGQILVNGEPMVWKLTPDGYIAVRPPKKILIKSHGDKDLPPPPILVNGVPIKWLKDPQGGYFNSVPLMDGRIVDDSWIESKPDGDHPPPQLSVNDIIFDWKRTPSGYQAISPGKHLKKSKNYDTEAPPELLLNGQVIKWKKNPQGYYEINISPKKSWQRLYNLGRSMNQNEPPPMVIHGKSYPLKKTSNNPPRYSPPIVKLGDYLIETTRDGNPPQIAINGKPITWKLTPNGYEPDDDTLIPTGDHLIETTPIGDQPLPKITLNDQPIEWVRTPSGYKAVRPGNRLIKSKKIDGDTPAELTSDGKLYKWKKNTAGYYEIEKEKSHGGDNWIKWTVDDPDPTIPDFW